MIPLLLEKKWLQLLILAAAVAGVYGHTLDVPFYFDDKTSIIDNPAIKHLDDLASLWQYAKLRFISYYTFALNYNFNGLEVAGYHVVNIFIHFLAGCAVFFLVQGLMRCPKGTLPEKTGDWLPILTALLFILHPLQTQAVTYIVQRSASLAALFYIGSMCCYVWARISDESKQRLLFGAIAILLACLALFTKQNTVTLPLAILLVELVFFQSNPKKTGVGLLMGVLLLAAVYGLAVTVFDVSPLSLETADSLTRETEALSRLQYLAIQSGIVWTYIRLFFWPTGLHLDYHVTFPGSITDPVVLAALAGHLLVIGLGFFVIRRLPYVGFGILFYYLAHLVESSIIPIRDIAFEHRTYLPNMGLCLAVAWLFMQAINRKKTPALLATAAVIVILAGATWSRNTVWKDPAVFWADCVQKAPDNPRPYLHLAQTLEARGELKQAASYYQQALQLRPDYSEARNFFGVFWAKQGQFDQAILHLTEALRLSGRDPSLHNNLGRALMETGQLEKAEFHLKEAIRLRPKYARGRFTLGMLMLRKKDLKSAKSNFLEVLRLDPSAYFAHNYVAAISQSQGKIGEAVEHYSASLKLNPNQPGVKQNLEKMMKLQKN
ncbi:MAG: tetratricopeptide repeat protein [Desulfobulbaceae bacterium]|nr:tetratricopeptide repeat protein [Desulfobulbaceae bacterium]